MTISADTKKKEGRNSKKPPSNTVDKSASLAGPARVPRHELSDQPGAAERIEGKGERERE